MKLGLLILIGLPGSGKTTAAKSFTNTNIKDKEKYCFIHICYDEILSFTSPITETMWKISRNSIVNDIENLIHTIKSGSIGASSIINDNELKRLKDSDSVVLIIDDNMYYKSMRYTLYQLAKKQNVSFCQMFFKCSLEMALNKNSQRNINFIIPPHIIENMYQKMEPPNIKNSWEKFSVRVDAFSEFQTLCDKLLPVLDESLNAPEKNNADIVQRQLSSTECQKNIIHQADLALRKIVSNKIKNFHAQNLGLSTNQYSLIMNTRKSELLCDIRCGNISFSDIILDEINQATNTKPHLINFLSKYF